MVRSRLGGNVELGRRRWTFGTCAFDERCWTLTVNGRRAHMETKPLEVLRELLVHAGEVVTKGALLDRAWADVTVVEASLPTAIRKLRLALADCTDGGAAIETVPGIGYRFAGSVEVENLPEPPSLLARASLRRKPALAASGALAVVALTALASFKAPPPPEGAFANKPGQRAQITAIRNMDVPAIEGMLAAGWDPNATYDQVGTNAMTWLLNVCEWDPQHDRRKMLLIARTFIDNESDIFIRNGFGDTAYSIAKADRYCGKDHPVTVMLRRMCVDSEGRGGDRCMATYQLARGEHFPG